MMMRRRNIRLLNWHINTHLGNLSLEIQSIYLDCQPKCEDCISGTCQPLRLRLNISLRQLRKNISCVEKNLYTLKWKNYSNYSIRTPSTYLSSVAIVCKRYFSN